MTVRIISDVFLPRFDHKERPAAMRVINFVSIDLIGAAKLITVDFKSAKLDTIPESIRGKNTSQEQTLQKGWKQSRKPR